MASAEQYAGSWYEDAIVSREKAFAGQFGPASPVQQVFKPQNEKLDEVMPGFAFLRYSPSGERPYWLYFTHGLSQPGTHGDFDKGFNGGPSGFGVEFGIATAKEEMWPFAVLELLTAYTMQGTKLVMPPDRIPASDVMEAEGGHLLAMADPGYPLEIATLSGAVRIIHMIGVTGAEIEKANAYPGEVGSRILELVLREFGVGCITDRRRACLTLRPDFQDVWQACEKRL